MTPTPFLILFLERSGSTYLVSLLNSHPDVLCRYEDFCTIAPEHVDRQLFHPKGVFENPTTRQIHVHLRWIFDRPAKASGFKLKFPYQYNRYPDLLFGLLKRKKQLRVIFLDRRDVVKRMISLMNLESIREQEQLVSANRVEHCENKKFKVDIRRLLNTMLVETHRRAELQALTDLFPNRLVVEYDDLLNSGEATMLKITEFLGVDPMPRVASRFKKATPDDLSDVVENYLEMQAAIDSLELP